VAGITEVAGDAGGDPFSDFGDGRQFFRSHGHQTVDIPGGTGQNAGHGFSGIPDSQGIQNPFKGDVAGILEAVQDTGCRFLTHSFEGNELFRGQVIEVGHLVHQAGAMEESDGFAADAFDVHGLTADEVFDFPSDLRGASGVVGAVPGGFSFAAHQGSAALGAVTDEGDRPGHGVAAAEVDTRDLGDDLPSFFDRDRIAQMKAESGNDVGIVEGGALHARPGQKHRLKVSHGGDGTRAPHLVVH